MIRLFHPRFKWRSLKALLSLLLFAGFLSYFKKDPKDSIGDIPKVVLDFERLVVPNAGLHGKEYRNPSQTASEREEAQKKYAFNKPISDQITLRRSLPDVRHKTCKNIQYDSDLPTASVILIFNNEALSALLRTVWSVIDTSNPKHLHEIILVDDGSNSTEITDILPLYMHYRLPSFVKLKKLPSQTGLIIARLTGAEFATGEAIIFLDSHCEAGIGWLEPLLQRIKDKPTNVVIPTIDSISHATLEYTGFAGSLHTSIGTFTWSGHFSWYTSVGKNRTKVSDPIETPTMAGGLFGVNREFFFNVGGYDKGMIGWGGENLELSFRVWRCHGSMENIPCSHVGHIFRSSHPYFIPDDSHGRNTMRMAEVWMDDYKRFYYLYRTDLRGKASQLDVSDRIALKEKLKCESFRWYLDNVVPNKFKMDEGALSWGRVRNELYPNICFDHLQKDMGHKMTWFDMGQYYCHNTLGSSQYMVYTKERTLRNEFVCAKAVKKKEKVTMAPCSDSNSFTWTRLPDGKLKHDRTGLCITAMSFEPSIDLAVKECFDDPQESKRQIWNFEFP